MAKKKPADSSVIVATEENVNERVAKFQEYIMLSQKKYGEGAIRELTDESFPDSIGVIPSGIIGVDRVTRIGGIPRGRTIEIYGPESSGKTTLMLHIVASAQRMGITPIAIVDTEFTLTADRIRNCGIESGIHIVSPSCGEEALDIAYEMFANGAELICIDSVAGLVPTNEIQGEMSDSSIALQARMMSKFLRKVTPLIGRTGGTLIFTNQIRSTTSAYGPSETTTGGNALRFYASLRLELRRKEVLKSGSESYANVVRVRNVKSKVDSPLGEEEFIMYYDAKKTPAASLLHTAEKLGVVKRNGSWYTFGDVSLGAGINAAVAKLCEDEELFKKLDEVMRRPENLTKKVIETTI